MDVGDRRPRRGARLDPEKLRAHRIAASLTQAELAALVDYSGEIAIYKLEAGERQPSIQKWIELADALHVDPEALEADSDASVLSLTHPELGPRHAPSPLVRRINFIDAAQQAKDNQARSKRIVRAVEDMNRRSGLSIASMDQAHEMAKAAVIEPFYHLVATIDGMETAIPQPEPLTDDHSSLSTKRRLDAQYLTLQQGIVDLTGTTLAAAGVGAATGAGVATVAYSATAAWATASTGTLISTLSGAASSSATLAALGGGSLAAGGMGMAGGTMLLGGLITAPVVLVAGAALFYQGGKLRRRAQSDSAKLGRAEEQLDLTRQSLERIWSWTDRVADITRQATAISQELFDQHLIPLQPVRVGAGTLGRSGADEARTTWAHLTDDQREAMRKVAACVAVILSVRSLPLLVLADDSVAEAEKTEVAEWIDLMLADAEERVDL